MLSCPAPKPQVVAKRPEASIAGQMPRAFSRCWSRPFPGNLDTWLRTAACFSFSRADHLRSARQPLMFEGLFHFPHAALPRKQSPRKRAHEQPEPDGSAGRPAAVPVQRRAGGPDRAGLAAAVGGRGHVLRAQPGRAAGRRLRAGRGTAEVLRARLLPLSERGRPARGPPARLHRHRRLRPVPAHDRPQRAALAGLRRVRPARRAVRDQHRPAPGGQHQPQHRQHALAAAPAGPGLRQPARDLHHRPRLLPLDPVDLPADLQQLVRRAAGAGPADRRADRRVRGRNAAARRPGQPRRPAVGTAG